LIDVFVSRFRSSLRSKPTPILFPFYPTSSEIHGKDSPADSSFSVATIGADPNLAIQSGTFAPGNTSDPTGRGNACDDPNDPIGCAITQNLLVPDVTTDEVGQAPAVYVLRRFDHIQQCRPGTDGLDI
jgi:hypothetical protein